MSNQYHTQTELFKDVYANNFYGNGVSLSGVVATDFGKNIPRDIAVLGTLSARNLLVSGPSVNSIIEGNLTITGNISAKGSAVFTNTVFSTTSALSVVNLGPGPALYIQQGKGNGDIASFYDGDGIEALHIGNAKYTSGQIVDGVIGINTGTPNKTLTVSGDLSANRIGFFGPSPNFTNTTLVAWTNVATNSNSINAGKSTDTAGAGSNVNIMRTRGTSDVPTAVVSGDTIGVLGFGGYEGTQYKTATYISGTVDGPVSAGIIPGSLAIVTTNTSGTQAERFRVDNRGKVGINSSGQTLTRVLDVRGDVGIGDFLTTGYGVSTGDTAIELGDTRTGNGNAYIDFHGVAGTDYDARLLDKVVLMGFYI